MRHSRQKRSEKGMTMVMLAVVIVVLLSVAALALDIGQLYVAKQRAQNVADASAMAGAFFLTGDNTGEAASETAADQCASSNNATSTGANWPARNPGSKEPGVLVTFPISVTTDAGESLSVDEGEAIRCEAEVPVEFGFARVMNLTNADVKARATALMEMAENLKGNLVPICVSRYQIWQDGDPNNPAIDSGTQLTMKVTSWQDGAIGAGNFGAISYTGDSGGNIYRDRLAGDPNVPPVEVSVGMPLDTLPGNKIGPTDQALKDRLKSGSNYTWDYWSAQYAGGNILPTPQVLVMPIIEEGYGVNGQKTVTVVGFAGFFVESMTGKGEVVGNFFGLIEVSDIWKYNVFGDFDTGENNLARTIHMVA